MAVEGPFETRRALDVPGMRLDEIDERTSGSGVVIDGLRLKDAGLVQLAGITMASPSELTIASGAVTATGLWHQVDTQGDAASDDLDTISGLTSGALLILQPASGSRTVVLKHNTGNIKCPGAADITLAEDTDTVVLLKVGASWIVLTKHTAA